LGKTNIAKNLYDAFERRDYAMSLSQTGEFKPLMCHLMPAQGEAKYCNSDDEFQSFVREYMSQ
jgi:hypothetical protein